MRSWSLLLLLAACSGCAPTVVVVKDGKEDRAVVTALRHTELAPVLGCTVVDVGKGLVVTAKHCVDHLDRGEDTEAGMLVYISPDYDYAILFDTARLGHAVVTLRAPAVGEHVYAVGYPMQLGNHKQELTVTDGVVAGPFDDEGNIRFTAPIYFGNSGGGVWGEDGALVGISVNGYLEMPGQVFMVPADAVTKWLPR